MIDDRGTDHTVGRQAKNVVDQGAKFDLSVGNRRIISMLPLPQVWVPICLTDVPRLANSSRERRLGLRRENLRVFNPQSAERRRVAYWPDVAIGTVHGLFGNRVSSAS